MNAIYRDTSPGDKVLVVDAKTETITDRIMGGLSKRYQNEKGKKLNADEIRDCWWSICGVVMKQGEPAAIEYANKVRFR